MSIKNLSEKLKTFFVPAVFLLVALLAFGLGRLTKVEEGGGPIRIESPGPSAAAAAAGVAVSQQPVSSNQIVASRAGERYHWIWCPGAKRIKEENKIFFASPAEARRAGLTPAANCPGLP